MLKEYMDNKELIHAYIKKDKIEGYSECSMLIMGLNPGSFFLMFFIYVAIWIWAIIALITYWSVIPMWAKVIGIIGVIPGVPFGPIITLLVVYLSKGKFANIGPV